MIAKCLTVLVVVLKYATTANPLAFWIALVAIILLLAERAKKKKSARLQNVIDFAAIDGSLRHRSPIGR